MPTCGHYIVVLRSCLNESVDLIIIPNVSTLANIGSAWCTMPKDGELFVRGVFDLGVRRNPQAFAADAVSLWIVNPSLLIINELELSHAKPRWRTQLARTASVGHNAASVAPAASFRTAKRPERQLRTNTRRCASAIPTRCSLLVWTFKHFSMRFLICLAASLVAIEPYGQWDIQDSHAAISLRNVNSLSDKIG